MANISILPEEAQWRARIVRYYSGGWESLQTVIPEFDLLPFTAGPNEPVNPYLRTVMRRPLSRLERATPIGVVSHTYVLAPHREVAALCIKGLVDAGTADGDLKFEVGLSELGEWMNFRAYLPEEYDFIDSYKNRLQLRLECFNSVEGSSRLVILFGWLRFVCSNGLVIGETKMKIRERHALTLNLESVPARIRAAFEIAKADRARMEAWQAENVVIGDIAKWIDETVTDQWGKKAAARVFHICASGKDVEFVDPFEPGDATQKQIKYLGVARGCPERAATKYDVSQALSYVATRRRNTEERVAQQSDIPELVKNLVARRVTSPSTREMVASR